MPLPLTGERTVPGVPHENYWFRRHEAAYRQCRRQIRGARAVLDAGAGEGYGAALIRASTRATVVALDYDRPALAHARRHYGLDAAQGNVVAMPFGDAAFDAVVSMQTVEHVWDQERFLAECARVLRPGGLLVVTTPNRLTFPPGNVFHSRELSAAELADLVTTPLEIVHELGVHHGPRLAGTGIVDDQLALEPHEWPGHLATRVAGVTAGDFVITADGIDECLDLYLVAQRA